MNQTLKLTQDGGIDIASLDEWQVRELREWLVARLSDADPLWPVDRENFETPEALFVWLWREARPGSDFVATLGRACDELLREAWARPPQPWLRHLLRLAATIRPDACHQFLNTVATHRNFSPEMRAQDMDEDWLQTLASYERQSPCMVSEWRRLLREPRYADIAYRALSHSLDLAVWSLPEYYQALSEQERPLLLSEAVRDMLRWDPSTVRESLWRYRAKLMDTPGLCKAIDAALKELACESMFSLAGTVSSAAPPPADQKTKPTPANGSCVLAGIATETPSARVAS